jgi:cyclin-dependent kinase 9
LQLLKHENIVHLIEICRTKGKLCSVIFVLIHFRALFFFHNIFLFTATLHNRYRSTFYLIFEFCEHDLAGLLSNVNVKFSLGEIKKVMHQLLDGLYYIHTNKVKYGLNYVYMIFLKHLETL